MTEPVTLDFLAQDGSSMNFERGMDSGVFCWNFNEVLRLLKLYGTYRNSQDSIIDQAVINCRNYSTESGEDAAAARDARERAESAATRSEDAAATVDGVDQTAEQVRLWNLNITQTRADILGAEQRIIQLNEDAVEKAQLAIEAAEAASEGTEGINQTIQSAANQAANQATTEAQQQMSAYLDAAQQAAASSGKSAYEIWLTLPNNSGTENDFILSLKGPVGATGATGATGQDGAIGASAYSTWVAINGGGTEQEFIAAITGADGQNGTNGQDGDSAYQVWSNNGGVGDEAAFLASIKGERGETGPAGSTGAAGSNGANGADGQDGADGEDGDSSYDIWLANGGTGSVADYLESLKADATQIGSIAIYVNPDAAAGGDGKTVAGAFQTLEDAFNAVPSNQSTEIFLAGGHDYKINWNGAGKLWFSWYNVTLKITHWNGGTKPRILISFYGSSWAYSNWGIHCGSKLFIYFYAIELVCIPMDVAPTAGYYPYHTGFIYPRLGCQITFIFLHGTLTTPPGGPLITPYVHGGNFQMYLGYSTFNGGGDVINTNYSNNVTLYSWAATVATDTFFLSHDKRSATNTHLQTNYAGAQLARA